MRADRRNLAITLALAFAFGAAALWIGAHGHNPWGAIRSLSAPWLLLPFVAGAFQHRPKRAAILGLGCTYAGLVGYGLMIFSMRGHALTLAEPVRYLSIERYTFAASLVTGSVFGWLGWRWRSQRAIVGALALAAAFCLEPIARRLAERPIRFSEVAAGEVAAGLALAAAILVRRARPA